MIEEGSTPIQYPVFLDFLYIFILLKVLTLISDFKNRYKKFYSTVTDLAKFLGLSTSHPLKTAQ